MEKVIIHFTDRNAVQISFKSWELIMDKANRDGIGNLQSIFEDGVFVCSFMITNLTFVELIKTNEN